MKWLKNMVNDQKNRSNIYTHVGVSIYTPGAVYNAILGVCNTENLDTQGGAWLNPPGAASKSKLDESC